MAEIKDILEERGKTHGDFRDVAELSQALKSELRKHTAKMSDRAPFSNSKSKTNSQCEALDNIAQKMARIVCGNPNEPDHWRDIAGYALLIVNELEQKASEPKDGKAGEDHG